MAATRFHIFLVLAALGASPVDAASYGAPSRGKSLSLAAGAQDPVVNERLQSMLDREQRIGFTPASGRLALQAWEASTDITKRAQALITLGIVGSVSSRPLLERAAQTGPEPERCAAVLALGELGNRVASADLLLTNLLEDRSRRVAECALYSLLRTRPDVGFARAKAFANNPSHPLNPMAPVLVDWLAGRPTLGAEPALIRLTLRWEAARNFGTVDGLSWEMQRVSSLGENQTLLDEIVLIGAAEIGSPEVRDYLFELLVEPVERPVVVRAAVISMPEKLDQLIATGLWAPRSPEEWAALIDEAEIRGFFGRLPHAAERAAQVDNLLARVAPFLAREDERFLDAIEGLLASRDAPRRAQVAFAIGEARIGRFLPQLRNLAEDDNVAVRATARVARARLGDPEVLNELLGLFVEERDAERTNRQEREFVLDSMYRTRRSATTQSLVRSLADSLRDASGQAERYERAALLAIHRIGGHTVDADVLIEAYSDPEYPLGQRPWLVEALGEVPDASIKKLLAAAFPAEGGWRPNLPLVRSLLQSNSEAVAPLLHSAVWQAPQQRSILAAAMVEKHYGLTRLMHWIDKPPSTATATDLRRVGFAVGTIGRMRAVEDLQRQLGTVAGAERPALQGALLGALAARTR